MDKKLGVWLIRGQVERLKRRSANRNAWSRSAGDVENEDDGKAFCVSIGDLGVSTPLWLETGSAGVDGKAEGGISTAMIEGCAGARRGGLSCQPSRRVHCRGVARSRARAAIQPCRAWPRVEASQHVPRTHEPMNGEDDGVLPPLGFWLLP